MDQAVFSNVVKTLLPFTSLWTTFPQTQHHTWKIWMLT